MLKTMEDACLCQAAKKKPATNCADVFRSLDTMGKLVFLTCGLRCTLPGTCELESSVDQVNQDYIRRRFQRRKEALTELNESTLEEEEEEQKEDGQTSITSFFSPLSPFDNSPAVAGLEAHGSRATP